MRSNNESGGGSNGWGCVIIPGIILIVLFVINILSPHLYSLDGDVYDNKCYHIKDKEDFIGTLINNKVDIDNLQPVELPEKDSMSLTFQFKFPFMFSIPDKAEMLVYLRYAPVNQKGRKLVYAAPFPENHTITFRVPKIHEYPNFYFWEFWLISRSELTVCRWKKYESLDFENENAPHNYRVKLLTRAYGDYPGPDPLRTTIFTPM